MAIQSEKNITNITRLGPFSAVLLRIVRRLIWLFTLTEEERMAAGIYWSNEGRGR